MIVAFTVAFVSFWFLAVVALLGVLAHKRGLNEAALSNELALDTLRSNNAFQLELLENIEDAEEKTATVRMLLANQEILALPETD